MKKFLTRLFAHHGSVLVEMAFITTLLVSMLFGTLEISRALRVQQEVSLASRESAAQSFRVCALMTDPLPCLNQTRSTFTTFMNRRGSGTEIILSVYKHNPAGPNPITQPETIELVKISGVSNSTGRTPGGQRSKFTPADVNGHVNLYRRVPLNQFATDSVNSGNKFIAISEIYMPYKPIGLHTPGLGPLNGLLMYESTIY